MSEPKFFPRDKEEALALLYVQSQNLSGKEPDEIARLYQFAKRSIFDFFSKNPD